MEQSYEAQVLQKRWDVSLFNSDNGVRERKRGKHIIYTYIYIINIFIDLDYKI